MLNPKTLPALLLTLLLALAGPLAARPLPARERPNIIVIMADDMGISDLGCYGSEIRTPNLDRLARGGLRFTQFYNTGRCCPTRASLLTGLYPHQAGVGHMVGDYGLPGYRGFLNDRCVTLAEVLRGAGYRTYQVGKWHVGENRPHWPVDRGFEQTYSLVSGGSNYFFLDAGRKMALGDRPYAPPNNGYYMTDAFTENAVRFVGDAARKEEPFFLYLAYTAPHWPLHARPQEIARYRGKYRGGWDALRRERHARMVKLGLVDARWPLTPRDTEVPAWETVADKDAEDLKMAVYAAQVDRMDQGVGRLMARLRETGQEENTLVLFLADNGGCAEKILRGDRTAPPGGKESFKSYGPPWANASNTPFRLYKHWVHEGGISTPLIAYWPAGIRRRGVAHDPGHLIDVMATCVDASGAPYPKSYLDREIPGMEGTSLLPVFAGKRLPARALYWEHEGNRAVRRGKWKLVSRFPDDWELYDLEADRTELHNLAAAQPERVREMAALYAAWSRRCGVEPWRRGGPRKVQVTNSE